MTKLGEKRERGMPHVPFRYVLNTLMYVLLTRAFNSEQFKRLRKRRVFRERSVAQCEVVVVCYVNSYGCY